ncbi:suppressor of fused domain protein [Streptomyces olivoverticillatus]
MSDLLALVEARLLTALGEPDGRAAVTFLGTDRIEVLRFTTEDEDQGGAVVRYATLGMSAQPMADPTAVLADPVRGPRAELLLSVRAGRADTDKVLRPLAVLAASPQVEGVVVAPGASLDTGEPLWPGGGLHLRAGGGGRWPGRGPGDGRPDGPRPLPSAAADDPPNEAAWKRVQGAAALQERWLRHGTDLRDPLRQGVPLG